MTSVRSKSSQLGISATILDHHWCAGPRVQEPGSPEAGGLRATPRTRQQLGSFDATGLAALGQSSRHRLTATG